MRELFRILFNAVALLLVLFSLPIFAQEETDKSAQSWIGTLDVGAAKLKLRFDFERDESGKFRGQMISLDQGDQPIKLDKLEIDAKGVVLELDKLKIKFEGKFDETKQELVGDFVQSGKSYPLVLKRDDAQLALKHIETWQGKMLAGAREFDFQLRLFAGADNKLTDSKLDSFSENLPGLRIVPKSEGDEFSFEVPLSKARYEGRFSDNKNKIEGKWIQGGNRIDLNFERVELAETRSFTPPKRPQMPKGPFPYRQEEVSFKNDQDDVTLSGTLTLPKDDGRYPAVILITGSGPQDRDETLLGHKPFLVIADYLTRHGLAVLRYDERGVGKSTGDFEKADSRDFARDAEAALEFLKQHAQIDAKKIGLIGHSEGAYVAPMIAARRTDVACIVMLAGPGVTGREIILNQTELVSRAEGASEKDMELQKELLTKILAEFDGEKTEEELLKAMENIVEQILADWPDDRPGKEQFEANKSNIEKFSSPWFRFFLQYDPRLALRQVKCPVLVLNGEKDLQIDPKLNLPEIEKAFQEGANQHVIVQVLPGLNHLFQTAKTGSPTEYQNIEETFSPTALKIIADWLTDQTN